MADVQVRPARLEDVAEISRIQSVIWRTAYQHILPAQVLEAADESALAPAWAEAVRQPPTTAHRVLVALEQNWRVGFVTVAPADPDDTVAPGTKTTGTVAVGPLLVEPRWSRRGHGSRLLAAAVELARGDGSGFAVSWVLEKDAASLAFLESAGWERDGVVRELEMPGRLVREVRLHTDLRVYPDSG